jgi:hypothetical protein
MNSPEERCLLLLAQGRLTSDAEAEARLLTKQELSGRLILTQARRQGVFPLLAKNLAMLDASAIPEEVRTQLEDACRANAARNALLVRELTRVLGVLDRAGVPAAPLKGVALANLLYGDITLRVCSDIDVLIPRHAVSAAVAALRVEGYLAENELWASASEKELVLDSDIETAFRRGDHAAAPLVDLHWDIARRWRGDSKALDDLWAEASRTTFWGVGAYRLSPEWELLYLAAHAVRHRWRVLKWLVDIHDYASSQVVDWDRLAAKADNLGWGRALRLTLGLSRELFGTTIPETLALQAPRWVLAQRHGRDMAWKDALIPARVLDRRLDRLGYLLRLFLRPTILERRAARLPDTLYYPLRPLRLAARWAGPIAASALQPWRSR